MEEPKKLVYDSGAQPEEVFLRVNEAYINHNFSKEHLRFIRKYKLGRVLPETVASGYCTFQKVAFDLKKLAEYDPQGTREFMESHGIQIADAPKQKPKNKSQRER